MSKIYLLDVVPEEKLKKRVIVIIEQDGLEIGLLLHFYQFVKILLCCLVLLQFDLVIHDSSYAGSTFDKCGGSGR